MKIYRIEVRHPVTTDVIDVLMVKAETKAAAQRRIVDRTIHSRPATTVEVHDHMAANGRTFVVKPPETEENP